MFLSLVWQLPGKLPSQLATGRKPSGKGQAPCAVLALGAVGRSQRTLLPLHGQFVSSGVAVTCFE